MSEFERRGYMQELGLNARCPHGNELGFCEVCARMANGNITKEEIAEYWQNPDRALFASSVEGKEGKIDFEIHGLTDKDWKLLKNLFTAWDLYSFVGLERTLTAYREQRKDPSQPLLGVEYYTAVDTKTRQPFAITGLYSYDIYGPGFASMERLNPDEHQLATGLGWFSVGKKYQGAGMGKYLFQWTENMAKSRGAGNMFIETDTSENTRRAVAMYEKAGYKPGFHTPDYFGPGRDLNMYYKDLRGEKIEGKPPRETLNDENKQEVLDLARTLYTKDRFEEFEVAMDLMLQQKKPKAILDLQTFVLRDERKQVESFGAMFTGAAYRNVIVNAWSGARPEAASQAKMLDAVKAIAKDKGKEVVICPREGEDSILMADGFTVPKEGGIPRVFAKSDDTELLLYTKKLN